MAKRFTDSEKWKDKWFRGLPAEHKLAYLYLLDQCDHAGVIELDYELAEFQMGTAPDWTAFLANCDGRVMELDGGKLWLVKFIEFQYGELSSDCRAHRPVFQSIEKHQINTLSKGYSKGIQRGQDMDKDKDKDSKNKKIVSDESDDWKLPGDWDTAEVQTALDDWASMRKRKGCPVKSKASTSKLFKRFDSPEHLIYAAELCEANGYQGIKPDYRPSVASNARSKGNATSGPVTFAKQREANMRAAGDEFIQEAPDADSEDSFALEAGR